MNFNFGILILGLFSACVLSSVESTSSGEDSESNETEFYVGDDKKIMLPVPNLYPKITSSCSLEAQNPTRLLVTSTDFTTGAVSLIDIASKQVSKDIALASNDAVPFFAQNHAYIINRYMNDYIDVLNPTDSWQLNGQFAIQTPDLASTNPHSLVLGPQGFVYVVLYEAPKLQIYDFTKPASMAYIDSIDLTNFADSDGIPEASMSFTCGSWSFVSIQRLDRKKSTWPPVDHDFLIVIDMNNNQPVQLHSDSKRLQGLELLGTWARQIRADPTDLSQQTALILTTGIARVDLKHGQVSWLVSEQALANVGIDAPDLPQAFDVSADGNHIYLAAYRQDFTAVDIYHLDISKPDVVAIRRIISGLNAVHQTLEIIGHELWFGDTTPGHAGLWVYDLTTDPPQRKFDYPLSVGLPPYSILAIP